MQTRDGAFYRRRLPHYRSPGSAYHVRFSAISPERNLTEDWMFEIEMNRRMVRRGANWEEEYFDRTVRGDKDLVEVIDYIHHNPVRWKLVTRPELYRWSSASTIYSGKPEFDGWFML